MEMMIYLLAVGEGVLLLFARKSMRRIKRLEYEAEERKKKEAETQKRKELERATMKIEESEREKIKKEDYFSKKQENEEQGELIEEVLREIFP